MAFPEQLLPIGLVAPDLQALHGREQLVFLVLQIRSGAFDGRFQMVGCGSQFRYAAVAGSAMELVNTLQ